MTLSRTFAVAFLVCMTAGVLQPNVKYNTISFAALVPGSPTLHQVRLFNTVAITYTDAGVASGVSVTVLR